MSLVIRGCIAVRLNFSRGAGYMKRGEIVRMHAHRFDHTLALFHGSIRLSWMQGATRAEVLHAHPFSANAHAPGYTTEQFCLIAIPKGVPHEIEAMEDDTYSACIFPHQDHLGRIVERWAGIDEATH